MRAFLCPQLGGFNGPSISAARGHHHRDGAHRHRRDDPRHPGDRPARRRAGALGLAGCLDAADAQPVVGRPDVAVVAVARLPGDAALAVGGRCSAAAGTAGGPAAAAGGGPTATGCGTRGGRGSGWPSTHPGQTPGSGYRCWPPCCAPARIFLAHWYWRWARRSSHGQVRQRLDAAVKIVR